VAFIDGEQETGARNQRKVSAAYSNTTGNFEIIHGLLCLLMTKVGVAHGKDFNLAPSTDPIFFDKRGADIMLKGKKVGVIGTLHPEVLGNYDIPHPVTCFEVDMEALYANFKEIQKSA